MIIRYEEVLGGAQAQALMLITGVAVLKPFLDEVVSNFYMPDYIEMCELYATKLMPHGAQTYLVIEKEFSKTEKEEKLLLLPEYFDWVAL